jgi:hypothetical protein
LGQRDLQGLFSLVLDGTVCPINRPINDDIQRLCYSGKHKIHSIKYEIGVHPVTGLLVWIGGPVPGSMHDMKLMYLGRILQGLFPQEFILGDMGYIGNWRIITPFKQPCTIQERILNAILSARRWIVEHVLARFKSFHCLSTKWRHDREMHGFVFFVLAEIINIDMLYSPVRQQ